MNKKQVEYNEKYRKNKTPLYVYVEKNIMREFKMICKYKGFKVNFTIAKLLIDFNKKNEVKPLN